MTVTLSLSRAFLHSSLMILTRGHRCEGLCWNVPSNSTSTAQRLQTRSLMCRPTVGLVQMENLSDGAAELTRIHKTRPALLMQEQQHQICCCRLLTELQPPERLKDRPDALILFYIHLISCESLQQGSNR